MDYNFFVNDIDLAKRRPIEWAKIYKMELKSKVDGLWSEYEWAYRLNDLDYTLLPDRGPNNKLLDSNFESEEMEIRALSIKADLFKNADAGEKLLLKEKYINTEMVKQKLLLGN